jgi:hypothetical protein
MACDKHDALADELVGDRDGLAAFAGVVTDLKRELLAEHAAGGVDLLDGHFRAGLHLLAERRVLPGHRTGRRDGDVGPGLTRHCEAHGRSGQ